MPCVILPKYRGYAIHVDGTVRRLSDDTIVAPRTVVDLWVKGRVVSVEHGWLYALAYGHDLNTDVTAHAHAHADDVNCTRLEKEIQALLRHNSDLQAQLRAVGIF